MVIYKSWSTLSQHNQERAYNPWIQCCCSIAQWCQTLWDPMDSSTPGFPVLHCLPEFAQTHVREVTDAIQPSHPLSPPLLLHPIFPSLGSFPVSQLFTSGEVLEHQHQSFQWKFRIDFLYLCSTLKSGNISLSTLFFFPRLFWLFRVSWDTVQILEWISQFLQGKMLLGFC